MANKLRHTVRFLLTTRDVHEVELTPTLRHILDQLGDGNHSLDVAIQIHDQEWLNLNHIVSWSYHSDAASGVIDESGGGVYEAEEADTPWQPQQSGGVITSEPDMITRARERGEDVGDEAN